MLAGTFMSARIAGSAASVTVGNAGLDGRQHRPDVGHHRAERHRPGVGALVEVAEALGRDVVDPAGELVEVVAQALRSGSSDEPDEDPGDERAGQDQPVGAPPGVEPRGASSQTRPVTQ